MIRLGVLDVDFNIDVEHHVPSLTGVAVVRDELNDRTYPSTLKGKATFEATAHYLYEPMLQPQLQAYAEKEGCMLGMPKGLLRLATKVDRQLLSQAFPLLAPGDCSPNRTGAIHAMCMYNDADNSTIRDVWIRKHEPWNIGLRVLLLKRRARFRVI